MKPIIVALGEYGNDTWPDPAENPAILKYFHEIGYEFIDDDETPWCAAFLNWILKQCQITGTKKLNARSFLNIGQATQTPKLGDLVILWRISPEHWAGHCGLFIKESNNLIWILGGNQSGKVCISTFSKKQLLGYRTLNQ